MTCLAKYVLKSPAQFCSGSISSIHLCFDMFIRLENWCFICFENFKELLDWIHYHCCREHSDRVKNKHVYFSISNFHEWSLSWIGPLRKWLVNHPILVGKTSISNCFFWINDFQRNWRSGWHVKWSLAETVFLKGLVPLKMNKGLFTDRWNMLCLLYKFLFSFWCAYPIRIKLLQVSYKLNNNN